MYQMLSICILGKPDVSLNRVNKDWAPDSCRGVYFLIDHSTLLESHLFSAEVTSLFWGFRWIGENEWFFRRNKLLLRKKYQREWKICHLMSHVSFPSPHPPGGFLFWKIYTNGQLTAIIWRLSIFLVQTMTAPSIC